MTFSYSDMENCRTLLRCIPDANETKLIIPEDVKLIHIAALRSCTKITHITFPSGINSDALSGDLFAKMTALEHIEIADHPELFSREGVLYRRTPSGCRLIRYPAGRTSTCFFVPEDVNVIGSNAFSNTVHLQEVLLHTGVRELEDSAFSMCASLRFIQINSSKVHIRKKAFRFCSALEEVFFLGKLIALEDLAFSGCIALKRINLPEGLDALGREVFANCSSLEPLHLPRSICSIGTDAFYGCGDSLRLLCTKSTAALIPQHHDCIKLIHEALDQKAARF